MRTVLIGSDLMYNNVGNLVPIEINTNLGWIYVTLEGNENSLDLTELSNFISNNTFTKVVYIGNLQPLSNKLTTLSTVLGFEFQNMVSSPNSITVPYVEDNDTTLIIRSAYDTTALVDDTYCANKVNFLNLIKNSTFGSQFAYLNEANELVNNITTIPNNGVHPNFILKAVGPEYDTDIYPKLFRVTTTEELNIVLQNVNSQYFLMEYHLDLNNLYENQIQIFRGLNLLFPPNLESISLGGYTSLTGAKLEADVEYNTETFEMVSKYKNRYFNNEYNFTAPKLLDTDTVEMADGSFKTALDLQVGDLLKTIDIPNPNNIDLTLDIADFGITYEDFINNTVYSTNAVTAKERVSAIVDYVKLEFTDTTFWEDTITSNYLIIRNNNVKFVSLGNNGPDESVQIGDSVILINTENETLTTVLKEVSAIVRTTTIFSGWVISVERQHLFLTQTTSNTSFVAIEHNIGAACTAIGPSCPQGVCAKTEACTRFSPSTMPCTQLPCKCVGNTNCVPIPLAD
jgi:hypothetical protein